MKLKHTLLVFVPMLLATTAFGQDEKWNVSTDYSYLRFNPSLTGLQTRSFNGGGGAVQWNLLKFVGIKADLQGYGSTSWTVTYPNPIVTPKGTVPAGTYRTNGNMFTWMFGPVVRFPASRFTVFAQTLFGGSNSNGYGSFIKQIDQAGGSIVGSSGTQHPFTMAAGGGVDFNVSKVIAIRFGEVDYVLTRYTNPLISTNNQNSFRYLGGVVFKFGAQ